jgi:uncharacterized protein YndB with AHSA1/START domain
MAALMGEITIDRPVEEVFDAVADERNEPRYNPAMISSEKLTEGPIGRGTRFSAVHNSGRGTQEMIVEVTEYDRPRRVASSTTMPWANIDGVLELEPVASGTRMRWNWHVHPKGVHRLLGPVVGVMGRRSEQACWQGLKRYLERGIPANSD